uniref:Transposase n=1 Tax=Steinernema glaseri TaxID=37863 RepID=A0A1I7ZGJ1_9BILA
MRNPNHWEVDILDVPTREVVMNPAFFYPPTRSQSPRDGKKSRRRSLTTASQMAPSPAMCQCGSPGPGDEDKCRRTIR